MGVENMQNTIVLEEPVKRQIDSELVAAVMDSNREIERRGNALVNGEGMTAVELMKYYHLADNIGYGRSEETGRDILNEGGTFPAMKLTSVLRYGNSYALSAVEEKTGIEFTLPCGETLRQYVGKPIDLRNPGMTLQVYRGKDVAIDVARKASGYEVVMIGLTNDVLGDSSLDTRLDLLN